MRPRIRVEDPWGDRWTVRPRLERFAKLETEANWRTAEACLRDPLRQVLAPQPGPRGAAHAVSWLAASTRQCIGLLLRPVVLVAAVVLAPTTHRVIEAAVALIVVAVWLNARANPMWVVDLVAERGARRGATWKVAGRDEATRAADGVAAAVRSGQDPRLDDAVLIHVVDERLRARALT